MSRTPAQAAAPESFDFCASPIPPGLTVIEASAGTGKTYAISHLVPRLLLEGTLSDLRGLVLVTFTNDAAKELSDRVRRVMGLLAAAPAADEAQREPGVHALRTRHAGDAAAQERLRRAMLDLDQLCVATIHSFCQRVLQMEGTLCGLPSIPELVPDAEDLIGEALHDLWQRHLSRDPLLSSIVETRKWDMSADASFLRSYLSLDNPEFRPPVREWNAVVSELRTRLAELPAHFRAIAMDLEREKVLTPKNEQEFKGLLHFTIMLGEEPVREQERLATLGWVAVLDGKLSTAKGKKPAAEALLRSSAMQACLELESLLEHLQWHWQVHCAQLAKGWIEAKLTEGRLITYDGIITTLHKALHAPVHGEVLRARLAERHLIGIIDESQDTDARQYAIFRRIFLDTGGEHRLVLIGDPKQSIYAFRGADVNTYLTARDQPGALLYTLGTTYRSPAALVTATNAFFSRPSSLLNPLMRFHPATSGLKQEPVLSIEGSGPQPPLEAWLVDDSRAGEYSNSRKRLRQVTSRVAAEIARLLVKGRIQEGATKVTRLLPGDFAVLASKTAEADAMAEALRMAGIPAVISTGDNIMAGEEALELNAILRAILHPRHSGLRFAALATRLLGWDSLAIARLREDGNAEEREHRRFTQWLELWETRGIPQLLTAMEEQFDITRRLSRLDQGERRVTNFRHLCDLLQATQRKESLRPSGLAAWLSHEVAQASSDSKTSDEERQLRLESDSDAVQIVTMHKSKGLEYKLVFCPFLWSTTPPFPLEILRRGGQDGADLLLATQLLSKGAPEMAALFRNQLEDRLRLAYVALTRAKVHAWIYCGAIGSGGRALGASCLDWLLRANTPEPCDAPALQAWKASVEGGGKKSKDGQYAPGRGAFHRAGLECLRTLSGGRIAIVEPPSAAELPPPGAWRGAAAQPVFNELILPVVPPGWGITSFSALTKEKHSHDSSTQPAPAVGTSGPPEPVPPCNLFLDAPAGAAVGTAIHEWIEEWDFGDLDEQALRAHLARHRLGLKDTQAPDMTARTADMLTQLCGSVLQGLECTIAAACPAPHASEWHFNLPIRGTLTTEGIARAFREAGGPGLAAYASMIESIPSARLAGLLQGFIDRLVFHEGRWGVIDWKTNRLGTTAESYGQAGLLQCALNEHYLLQAHLYLVALRRHLRLSDPAATPAGAWLVFLRAAHAGTHDGVLHINPGEALLDALDALFA